MPVLRGDGDQEVVAEEIINECAGQADKRDNIQRERITKTHLE